MGIGEVAVDGVGVGYRAEYILVGVRIAVEYLREAAVAGCVKYASDALDVGRVANIHGAGNSPHRTSGVEDAGVKIAHGSIVYIVGHHESAYREPHLAGQKSGCKVAEVAAGHGDNYSGQMAQPVDKRGVCVEEVEQLRYEAADVYGVGRGESC